MGDGEFQALKSYLESHGIGQRISCPYTFEQNGCAECKHRHLVNTAHGIIHTAKHPLKYWNYEFYNANHIISHLLTPLLEYKSPFECLFREKPDYHNLKGFGCLCFPWVHPYTLNKLEPCPLPYVFLGYSN